MAVLNIHERRLAAPGDAVGALIDQLASTDDRLWPRDRWPAMRFDRPLAVGAAGGHGPVRYTVVGYAPGMWVRFAFTGPRGFVGFHEYTVYQSGPTDTLLRHTLAMRLTGAARLTWPALYRALHDALIEDSLDRAEWAVAGGDGRGARWSAYVRALRRLAGRRRPATAPSRPRPGAHPGPRT